MVDTADLKSSISNGVWVRVPLSAPIIQNKFNSLYIVILSVAKDPMWWVKKFKPYQINLRGYFSFDSWITKLHILDGLVVSALRDSETQMQIKLHNSKRKAWIASTNLLNSFHLRLFHNTHKIV